MEKEETRFNIFEMLILRHKSLICSTDYNKTSCFKYIKFVAEDTKIKHANITTIYKDN